MKMETSGILVKCVAVLIALTVMASAGSATQKLSTCCTWVSKVEITEHIIGYRLQTPDPPCVLAVIFETEKGRSCSYFKSPWVKTKIRQLKMAQENKKATPPLSTTSSMHSNTSSFLSTSSPPLLSSTTSSSASTSSSPLTSPSRLFLSLASSSSRLSSTTSSSVSTSSSPLTSFVTSLKRTINSATSSRLNAFLKENYRGRLTTSTQ